MFKRSLLLALAVTLAASGVATAATWYGDVSTDWSTATNWSDYAAPNGDFYIRALPLGGVSNECTITTPGAYGGALYVVNGGVFNVKAPTYYAGGIAAFQIGGSSAYVYVTEGTMNVSPAYLSTVTNPNSMRAVGNLYVGYGTGANGVLNIEPNARVTIKGALTIGGNGSTAVGTLNLWGHIDCGNGLRLSYNGGRHYINLYQGADFYANGNQSAALNTSIVNGNIMSMVPGLVPVVDYNSTNDNTWMRLVRTFKATAPSPANGSAIQNMSTASETLTMSWLKPLPEDPTKPVTSNVYISTDPNMLVGVTTLATGIAGSSVDATVDKLQTYYWRVDSSDPNRGVLTTGDRWTFNTNNTAPAVSISAPYLTDNINPNVVLWLPDNASTTVTAVVTDDGYPLAGPVTYSWDYQDPVLGWQIGVSTASTLTTPTYTSVSGTHSDGYNWRVVVKDGTDGLETTRTFAVNVYRSSCDAAPTQAGWAKPVGELSGDCKVNLLDMAIFATNWLGCNASGGVCF